MRAAGWTGIFDGDQTLGRGMGFWLPASVVVALSIVYGLTAGAFAIENAAYLLLWVFMAMGLSLIWGYGGVLSFGQTLFFGIGGYTYGLLSINLPGEAGLTLLALAGALVVTALACALLGYFLFYGGVSGVFVGITTLATTLAAEAFLSQTAGPEWKIGIAPIGGFNGLTGVAPLTIPWFGEDIVLQGQAMYFAVLGLAVTSYLGLRILLNSRFGDALVAIRENPTRAATLGFNVPLRLTATFVFGGSLAGLSGALYTAWGQYITPDTMGLNAAVLPIVWVAVSGRADLTASAVGSVVLVILSQQLAVYGSQYALIAQAVILILAIFLAPRGLLLTPAYSVARVLQRLAVRSARPGHGAR